MTNNNINIVEDFTINRKQQPKAQMKRRLLTVLLLLMCLCGFGNLTAQNVQVFIEPKTTHFPSTLSAYIDNPYNYVRIRLINSGSSDEDVYLTLNLETKFTVDGRTFRLYSDFKGSTRRPKLTIPAGRTIVINNSDDFDQQFANRLNHTLTDDQVRSMGLSQRIPEGQFTFCVAAHRWNQNVTSETEILNEGCYNFSICYSGSAPELTMPIGGLMTIPGSASASGAPVVIPARNINFRWTGAITNCPQNVRFDYTLEMVKVLPYQNVYDAIDRNPTVYQSNTGTRTFCTLDTLRDIQVRLERGATYAVQVTATQRTSNNLTALQLGNGGRSQIQTFVWGEAETHDFTDNDDNDNYGNSTGGGTISGTGGTRDTSSTDTNSTPPVLPPAWTMNVKQSKSTFNNRYAVTDSILPPCLVLPEKDKITSSILTERRKAEESNFPEVDRTVVSTYLIDGTPVIDTAAKKKFDVKWLPASHKNILRVDYDVKLYEYMGNMEVTLSRPALKTKRFEGATNMYYGYENRVLRNLGDSTWADIMVPGKQYVVVLSSNVAFYYNTYTVTQYDRVINDIIDSTYFDTVARRTSDVSQYTSKLLFQWGIDNSLLDKLTPPQFTYPVNRSTASWDDKELMEFGDEIPEIPLYHDFSFDWAEAEGYDVSDTMLYDLYIYECTPQKKMSEIVKGKEKWIYKGINDLTLTDSIADSVQAGKKYVARLRVRTSPDSNKYNRLADGWSLPIAFKMVDTTSFMNAFDLSNACFPGDAANLSKKVITPDIDTMISKRTRLKMGQFDLIVQKAEKKGNKYSGEGFIIWRPLEFGCNIKVHFDSIAINENHQIIAGTAHSIETDNKNYIKLNIDGNKFAAGFDLASDKANEYMDVIAAKLGNKSEDVKIWYERINTGSNVLSEMIHSGIENDFAIGTVTTPVRIDNKMLNISNSNFALAINDFFFSPVTAQMNILAVFGSPRDNLYIPALATNICISPNSFVADSMATVNLFSPRDYDFDMADGYTLRFKKPSDFSKVADGCYMSIKKKSCQFNIDADIVFGKNGQDGHKLLAVDIKNSGIVDPSKPVSAHFRTTIADWDDWVVKISMDPFTILGCEDFTFLPTGRGIILDHSVKRTPSEVKFPSNYLKKGEHDKWKGLYIDYFGILLPEDVSNTFVDLNGEKDDTPDSTIIYRVGANGENTDTVEYVYPGTRISFTASHLLWDESGLSIDVSVNDIFKGDTRNGGGWYFSLDNVGIRIERDKFKYGTIGGKVGLPLFEGKMQYSCQLGSDSLAFAVSPSDSLNLKLFLAKVKLDPKSSFFRITHDFGGNTLISEKDKISGSYYTMLNHNSSTRIDLSLNGTIDVNFEKIGVEASLPAIKFEKMYLRNFREKNVQRGKNTVKAYEFGSLDFCIGNWSKASPQKYIGTSSCFHDNNNGYDDNKNKGKGDNKAPADEDGNITGSMGGFEYNISTIEPVFQEDGENKGVFNVGIEFGGMMSLGISESMSFGASAGFGISCQVNTKDWEVSNWNGHFDSVRFKTDIGPLKVDAAIVHTSDDPLFGNSWRGMAKVTVLDVVTCAMGCGFGSMPKPDGNGNFDWWYFEGAAQLQKGGVPLGPVSINGFGGGFAFNCAPAKEFAGASAKNMMNSSFVDNMVSKNGSNYKPQYDAWMAKAGISLVLSGDPTTLNADGTLNLRIANGHFSGICLQVNAHMMSSYDEDDKVASASMLDIGAFIDYTNRGKDDWTLTFSAIAKADINMDALLRSAAPDFIPANFHLPGSSVDEVKGAVPGCLSKYVEPMIDSTYAMNDVEGKLDKFNKHEFGGGASLQIPIDLYINKSPGKNAEWFFAVGRPAYEDRVRFSFNCDLVVIKSETEWTFYFMTGNHFPDGFALPAIPDEVAEFLGGKYKERAERGRILPTFKDAGGFAVGMSFKANIKYSMILFVEASAYIGFDAALINTKGQGCEAHSQIGKNNYYGMGQAYMMLKGRAGLELNLGFWKGQLDLIDAGLGAIVQAGGPNPTWAFGMLRFSCKCLGGRIKINTAVDFELGETCIPGASNPLANVKLFQSVTPGYPKDEYSKPQNTVSPFTTGVIVSNMPWNEEVLLTAVDQKNHTLTRKFIFILDEQMSTFCYKNKANAWIQLPMSITPNSSDVNTLYFQGRNGGFRENCEQQFHFYGRVFEWRTTDANNLSDWYKNRDTVYSVSTNRAWVRFAPNSGHNSSMGWRLPLYTDNEKTTFVTDKRFYQDTVIWLRTEDAPENLYNQVVYTWPYNGDPLVPIDELYRDRGHYKVLIYPYMHRDFLDPSSLDKSGRQIKAFLIESGWGESATAVACDYEYYENGFQGSSIPCIVVSLPSDFNPSRYNGRNLAVRLMLVRSKDYQSQLNALNNKADQLLTTVKNEQQSRSNLGELYSQYLLSAISGIQSGNTGMSLSQDSTMASGASTGEGNTNVNFNVQLAQLSTAANEYLNGEEADTAMSFDRKSLASGYVAAERAGAPVYNLYFRLCENYSSYKAILDNLNYSYLFKTNGQNHDASANMTFSLKKTPVSDIDKNTARFAYLFDEFVPNDPMQYKTGVRLPPLFYAAIDYSDDQNITHLYNVYAKEIHNIYSAVHSTRWLNSKRPKADCHQGSSRDHIFCTDVKSSNWCNYTDNVDNFYLNNAADAGISYSGSNNLINLEDGIRVQYLYSGYIRYSNARLSTAPIPIIAKEEFGPNNAPRLLIWKNEDSKARIDSLHMMGKSSLYTMTDFYTTTEPQNTYSASFQIVDKVTGAMLDDITKFNSFLQGLLDCGVYMHSRGYNKKIDEISTLFKQQYHLNTLSIEGSPYTFSKLVFGVWWLNSFIATYLANEETGSIHFERYKTKPFIERDHMVDLFNHRSALFWQDHVLHINRMPLELNKTKGSMWTTLFSSDSKYFNEFDNQMLLKDKTCGIVSEPPSGQADTRFKIGIFYCDYRNSHRLLGYAADRAKETTNNNDARAFIATEFYKPADAYYQFTSDLKEKIHKTIDENRGLKFRSYKDKENDKFDGNWWE